MTNGGSIITTIIEKRGLLQNIKEEIIELESDLCGMEIEYNGMYAVIESIDDSDVVLYAEDDETEYNVVISLYELLDII